MALECKNIRYAHEAGHTDICYGSDDRRILTCGADGNVRIFNGINDVDPTANSVSEVTLAVACTKNLFLVATDNNYVQAFTYPERKRDKIMFRFSAPVTDISVSSSGLLIAACSCDMEIQVLNTETNKITILTGHFAPVLGISLDPLDNFIVSSSCDGTMKIWDVPTGNVVKTLPDMVPKKNDFFKATSLGRTSWKSFSGSLLAAPKELDVIVLKRYSWELAYKLTSTNIEKELSAVVFSPCGNYIVGASVFGDIIIWEIKTKSEICYYKDPKKVGISGIAWHPDGIEISFTDRLGRLGTLEGIPDEINKHKNTQTSAENMNLKEDRMSNNLSGEIDMNYLFDEDEVEDDDNCISIEKIKASYKNESDVENSDDGSSHISLNYNKNIKEQTILLPKTQTSFQPSSTPFNFEPRCLCFNSVGIVKYYNSDKTVDVQFHDTTFHHALFLRSFGFCSLASLSVNVLCLGAPSVEDNLSKLTCVPLSSWAGSKEWTIHLPKTENIIALATSGNWVAVASNANYLRIFSSAGTQKQILSLPGPVVSMSGHDQKILLICHIGMGIIDHQNLGFIIYELTNLCVKAVCPFQPLPLSPKSNLDWVGFSDEGTPTIFDSEGILRFLAHDLLHWEVTCDFKNHLKPSDHYFIVGISERYQNVRCILCKNSRYPLIINTPTVLEVPLKLPLCDIESEKSTQEDQFWRIMFSLWTIQKHYPIKNDFANEISNFEQTLKQTSLKLFAEASRNSEDLRALDIANYMSSHPLEVAIKYASKAGKIYLAEKLNKIIPVEWKNQFLEIESITSGIQERYDNSENNSQMENSNINFCEKNFASDEKKDEEEEEEDVLTEKSSPEVLPQSFKNPFKKSIIHLKESPKGLQFFDMLPKELPKPNLSSNISKPPKLKPGTSCKNKRNDNTINKPTFVQWYSTKKASLIEEYPNLSSSELTKLGMKLYKETKSSECEGVVTESKKRKSLKEDDLQNKKSKILDQDDY